jgi:hypothetical protein
MGVVACSVLLDANLAAVMIARGRRTVSSSQVLLSGEKLPNFANYPVTVVPAVFAAVAVCPSNVMLPQVARLIGANPACTQVFRSDLAVRYCRGSIGLHYAPCSWRSPMMAMQALDDAQSQHVKKFLSGVQSSHFLPFSGLHSFATVGSAISFGVMQTAAAPSNDALSIFFGYRQGVFVSIPARVVPAVFDHTLTDWFLSCASVPYSIANSNDASSFPVRVVILPLRQSFAALSTQQSLPPVLVVARSVYYAPSDSQESDNDNFVGVFGVEVDIPSFVSVLNRNEICRLGSSNCVLTDSEGWILMDRHLQQPLTAMAVLQRQLPSEYENFQRPLRLHLSRQYSVLSRELVARGIARSSSSSVPWRSGLRKESVRFQIHLPSLPAVFEIVEEGVTVAVSLVPWSNAILFVLGSSQAFSLDSASGFGCGLSMSLDELQPTDVLAASSVVPVPQTIFRENFTRNPHAKHVAALALPWSSQWSSAITKLPYSSQTLGANAAPDNFNESSISNNADFFTGTLDFFTVHPCVFPGLQLSAILAGVLAFCGLLMMLALMYKHFQAVGRLFNVTVQMSLEPRNLSYSL